jgi:uncharacterized cupredoxin-like copper-binding protein
LAGGSRRAARLLLAIIDGVKRGLVAVSAALLLTGGGYYAYAAASATKIKVTEKEFKLSPSPGTAKHGSVTFTVKNTGALKHEFIVLKTSVAAGKLPIKGTTAKLVGKVEGKIKPMAPGQTKTLTVTLPAGKYILLCNLPAHYKAGQRAAFTVN